MDNKFNTIELLKEFETDPINQTLSEKYLSPTFLDIIGKSRSETVHTNFLKWLIHQKEWNKEFISRFLYALNEKSKEQGLKSFILEDEDVTISEIKASTEAKCVLKVNNKINKSYVDLLITCKLNEIPVKIIIENKIDSPEHDNQTWKYYTYFSNNDSFTKTKGIEVYQKKYNYKSETNELKIFVYLAPEWNNESISELGICEHFIRFTYQDLYDSVISFLRSFPKTERISFIFREYLEILFQPYVDKNYRLKTLVMEKQNTDNSKILRAFLKKNLPLFMLAVETVKNDTFEPDEIEALETIERGIRDLTKSHVLYDLEFPDGSITKNKKMREVSMEILNYLLKEEKPFASIKEILPDSDWLLTEKEYLDKSNKSGDKRFTKRYNKISRNYYLSNQWTKGKFLNFINMLNQQFPEFKLTSLSGE